MQEKHKAAKK